MTMHLVHPSLTTTGKTKKKPTKAQLKAKSEHEAWLKKQGLHPDQLSSKGTKRSKQNELPDLSVRVPVELSNSFAPVSGKTGIMENLHKEPIHVQNAIKDKANRVIPLYNKGPYQLSSENEDLSKVGSLSKRL
jgi:hypothetical protein